MAKTRPKQVKLDRSVRNKIETAETRTETAKTIPKLKIFQFWGVVLDRFGSKPIRNGQNLEPWLLLASLYAYGNLQIELVTGVARSLTPSNSPASIQYHIGYNLSWSSHDASLTCERHPRLSRMP